CAKKSFFEKLGENICPLKPLKEGFYMVSEGAATDFEKIITEKKTSFSRELVMSFVDPNELKFLNPEFREVTSVFLNCKRECEIDELVSFILSMKNEFGFSRPHVDFGGLTPVVLVFFGAPVSHENRDFRALDFILQVRERFDKKIKFGSAKGICYCGFIGGSKRKEFTCLGDSVNLASRMLGISPWGEAFVDSSLLKTRGFDFSEMGDVLYRGKTQVVKTFKLEAYEEKIFDHYMNPYVGRKEELKEFSEFLTLFENRKKPGFVLIEGETGVGKTRLASEIKNAFTQKFDWFYTPCDEVFRKSLGPIRKLIPEILGLMDADESKNLRKSFDEKYNRFLEKVPDDGLRENLKNKKSIIAGLTGILTKNMIIEGIPEEDRFEMILSSIKELIKASSLIKPVVIEIDNGQWIDSDSLVLLKRLYSGTDEYPIAVIIEKRPSNTRIPEEILSSNHMNIGIKLKNMDFAETSEFLKCWFPQEKMSSSFLEFVMEKSNGNPLFAEAISIYMTENRVKPENFDETALDFEVPSDIENLIISRIDGFSSNLKKTVKTAAVLGDEFSKKILCEILGEKDVSDTLKEGETQRLWTSISKDKYAFTNTLIRQTASEMQLKKDLRLLHLKAGNAIEKINANYIKKYYGELSYHFEKAGDEEKAIKYLKLAAENSKISFRIKDSEHFYTRLVELTEKKIGQNGKDMKLLEQKALFLKEKAKATWLSGKMKESISSSLKALKTADLLADKTIKVDVLIQLGSSFNSTGQSDKSKYYLVKAGQTAEKMKSKKLRAITEKNLGDYFMDRGEYLKAIKLYKSSLTLYRGGKNSKKLISVYGSIGLLYYYLGDYEKAKKYVLKQIVIAEKFGDVYEKIKGLGNLGIIYSDLGDHKMEKRIYARVMKTSKKIGYKNLEAKTLGNIAGVYVALSQYEKAIESYEDQIKISSEMGDYLGAKFPKINIASACISLGRYEQAQEALNDFFDYALKASDKRSYAVGLAMKAGLELRRGDAEKAVELYKRAIGKLEKMKVKYYSTFFRVSLAYLYLDRGNFKKAQKSLGKALEDSEKYKISTLIPQAKIIDFFCRIKNSRDDDEKSSLYAELLKIPEASKEKIIRAKANYYISILTAEERGLSDLKTTLKYGRKALKSFLSEYKKTKNEECRLYAESLRKKLKGIDF
ncbi:tetratricopeptide repeat protein, partial [candidate division WOR-3 bacterium]|nr:tetratricopeptide repeat protein [candidate division WOR-3 bacterium]